MDIKVDYNTVAIPTDTPELDALVGSRFARSQYFAIYNHDSLEFTFVKNDAKEEASGAGTKAAKLLGQMDIDIALVPEIGPKAFETLQAFDIRVFRYTKEYSVRDAIYELFEEKLAAITNHTKDGSHK